jgi:hypothetical protein
MSAFSFQPPRTQMGDEPKIMEEAVEMAIVLLEVEIG